jgi:iron complex outermembrane receptor protein
MPICRVVGALILLGALSSTLHAQELSQEKDFNIPPQPLAKAVIQFSDQSGIQVVTSGQDVSKLTTEGVKGRLKIGEALKTLLNGTHLGYSVVGSSTVALVSLASSANANAVTSGSESSIPATSEKTGLTEIIVTAQKREERQQDVPISMTVLNPQALVENGQNRLVDYFALVPGLSLSNDAYFGGTQYLSIRGLSTGYNQNPTVATVVDDVPVVGSLQTNNGMTNSPDLDPSDLSRIEVLKGPQGTLYGANSIGGVIKYVTVDPSTSAFSGRIEGGGVDILDGGLGYSIRGAANIPVSDTFAVRVSAFHRDDPGYIDNLTTGEHNINSADVSGGHFAALWRPSDNFSVKVSALIQQDSGNASIINSNSAGQFTQGDLNVTGLPGTLKYYNADQIYSANVNWKLGNVDIASVTGYVVNRGQNWADDTAYFGGTAYDCAHEQFPGKCQLPAGAASGILGAPSEIDVTVRKISQELRISSSVGTWLDWRIGGFYTHEDSPNANIYTIYSSDPTTGAISADLYTATGATLTYSEFAALADFTVHIADRFEVEAGGRESWDSQRFQTTITGAGTYAFTGSILPSIGPLTKADDSDFTYRVAPKFTISPNLMAYASVATGFRVGGPNSAAYIGNAVAAGVPTSFQPDQTTNYELGIKGKSFEGKLTFGAAAYYVDWKNIQITVTRYLAGQPFTYTINGGRAKSEGAEFFVETHPIVGLTIGVTGSYDDAALTQDLPAGSQAYGLKGNQLPYSARFSGGLTVNQDIPLWSGWVGFVGGSVNYVDKRPYEFTAPPAPGAAAPPRLEFPAYAQSNLRTGAHNRSWLVNLYLNNVANKRGIVGIGGNGSAGSTDGYYTSVIQPRTLGVTVGKTF